MKLSVSVLVTLVLLILLAIEDTVSVSRSIDSSYIIGLRAYVHPALLTFFPFLFYRKR